MLLMRTLALLQRLFPASPPPPFSGEKAPFHTPFRVTMLWLVKESWWIARLHLLGMITEGTGFDQ